MWARSARWSRASGRTAASRNLRHALGTPKHSADLPPGLRMTHLPEALCFRNIDDANHDRTQHRKLVLLHPTCIHHAWRGKGEGWASADLLTFASFSCFSLLGGVWQCGRPRKRPAPPRPLYQSANCRANRNTRCRPDANLLLPPV